MMSPTRVRRSDCYTIRPPAGGAVRVKATSDLATDWKKMASFTPIMLVDKINTAAELEKQSNSILKTGKTST